MKEEYEVVLRDLVLYRDVHISIFAKSEEDALSQLQLTFPSFIVKSITRLPEHA